MKELSNAEIVMLAFNAIGMHGEPIHQERIFAKCFELAPHRFAWKLPEYDKWPNTEIIRRALRSAGASGLIGCYAINWHITAKGIEWLREHNELCGQLSSSNNAKLDYIFLHKAQKSVLYQRYMRSGNIEKTDGCLFTDMLGLPPMSADNLIRRKVDLLMIVSDEIRDDKFSLFIRQCTQLFLEDRK